jgi:general secretion pathway protein J
MANIAPRCNTTSPGYTLVEMLVALSLVGFIALLISGTFQFGLRSWESSAREFETQASVHAVQKLLRRELSQTRNLNFGSGTAEHIPVFGGDNERLRFSAPLSIHHSNGGIAVFDLVLDAGDPAGDLTLQWQVFRPDAPDGPVKERATLLHDVEGVEISYFGRIAEKEAAAWRSEWRDTPVLPDLVQIRLVFPDSDRRVWPNFIVALKTGSGPQP